jgi:TRAP-type C4-dicarboxylate transport system substrate-binding protein
MMLVLALFLTAASTSAFAREFRAADTQNESYPTVQALHYMSSLIAERSGDRHRIKVFHSRQLGEEKETLEQTRAGAIDLNRTNVALIGTMVPAMNVLAMPFLFRSIEHLQKVLDGSATKSSAASNLMDSSAWRSTIPARARSTTASARSPRWPTSGDCGFGCSNPSRWSR